MSWWTFLFAGRIEMVRAALGLVAFVIYASATLLANKEIPTQVDNNVAHTGNWLIERAGIASAISTIVYGAPVATVYSNLLTTFSYSDAPLEQLIQNAVEKRGELGRLMPFVNDGIGIGQSVFTTVAMRMFGIHVQSIVYLFLLLMGISTFAFLARFRDERSVVVVLVFFALTVAFASPFGADPHITSQVPPAGHRYFSLLAILPYLHIFLEIVDPRKSRFTRANLALMVLQLVIFMTVYFMSVAAIYIYGALTLAAVFSFFAVRGLQERKVLRLKVLTCLGVIGLSAFAFFSLIPKAYKDTGRALPATTWHHVIIGFGAHPKWPFGNLAEHYIGCMPGQPQGTLVAGFSDFNGGCVWGDYAKRNAVSLNELSEQLYDRHFDAATREGALRIIRLYPVEAIMTFIYYKPLLVLDTLKHYFSFGLPAKLIVLWLIFAQGLVLIAFSAIEPGSLSLSSIKYVYSGVVLGALASSGLYIVSYARAHTAADLFMLVLVLLGALLATLLGGLFKRFGPRRIAAAAHGPQCVVPATLT